MRVDHAGHQKFALEVNLASFGAGSLQHGGERADGYDPVALDRDRVGIRMRVFGGEDVSVPQHGRSRLVGRHRGGTRTKQCKYRAYEPLSRTY